MKKLTKKVNKVLICGLGSIGKRHLKIIKDYWPHIKVSVLRSKNKEFYKNNEIINKNIDSIFYDNYEAIKWQPDCVILSNPANLHLENAIFFAKKRLHLLIEKPIGIGTENNEDWQKLISLNKNLKILVGYVFRHDLGIKLVKDQIKTLGKLIEADFYCGSWLPNWRSAQNMDYKKGVSARKESGGGVLLELSHEIDLAYWLLGSLDIKYAYLDNTKTLDIKVEDLSILHALNKEKCSISIRLNFCTKKENRHIYIKGSKGSLKYDLIKGHLTISKSNKVDEIKHINDSLNSKYLNQLKHFFECIEYNKNPICSLNDGLQVLEYIKFSKRKNINKYF